MRVLSQAWRRRQSQVKPPISGRNISSICNPVYFDDFAVGLVSHPKLKNSLPTRMQAPSREKKIVGYTDALIQYYFTLVTTQEAENRNGTCQEKNGFLPATAQPKFAEISSLKSKTIQHFGVIYFVCPYDGNAHAQAQG